MKKIFVVITVLLLTASILSLSGCKSDEDEMNVPTAEELIASYFYDITSSCSDDYSSEKAIEYLYSWVKDHNINGRLINKDLLLINADKNNSSPESLYICTIHGDNISNEMQYVSSMMYVIDNIKGKVGIAFVSDNGLNDLPADIISADNVIFLDYNEDKMDIVTQATASASYNISSNVSYTSSKYDTAYKIRIKDLTGGSFDLDNGSRPNAILTINNILANCKSSGLNYELYKLTGGSDYNNYTKGATAIVLVSKADEEKFEKKLEKSISKFESKWSEKEATYSYTYKKIDKPSSVLTTESAENLVSALYTMINGTYAEDEESENVIAYSSISKVQIKNGKATIKMNTYSFDNSLMDEMDTSIKTLAEISHYNVKCISKLPAWNTKEDSDIINRLTKTANALSLKLPSEYSAEVKLHEGSYIKAKNKDVQLLSIGCDFSSWADAANLLIEFPKN